MSHRQREITAADVADYDTAVNSQMLSDLALDSLSVV